ncbi:MAG: hypothetical protein M3454_00105 [Actinomycetota bacterium]|nr:hypothetical protein [Actinomycetota bacterium]
MDEEREREEEQGGVRRPRVVDKRVSARAATPSQTPAEPRASQSASIPEPPPDPPPVVPQSPPEQAQPGDDSAGLWTPEQEAEAQRAVDEILRVPARDWVADAAVRLAQVAGVKLDRGDVADARVAIDGFGALVNGCAAELGEAERPLRQTLAQLQMAYAQVVAQPPPAPQP